MNIKFNKRINGLVVMLLLCAVFVGLFFLYNKQGKNVDQNEINTILSTKDRSIRKDAYLHLIKRVGAIKAQEELHTSGVTYDGESHFLNHTVGEYLNLTYGYEGLAQCKEYFSASCYHGFLIDYIGENTTADIAKIMSYCKAQGDGVYFQCSHAMGHGYLAYLGYAQLVQALERCDKSTEITEIDLNACYGGVFMENTWGLHDESTTDQWVRKDDLSYPCSDNRLSDKYLESCWDEQPTLIYKYVDEDLSLLIKVCSDLQNKKFQDRCFRGIARLINPMTEGDLIKKIELCRELPEKWTDMCFSLNASTSYGQGDRQIVFQICDYVVYGSNRALCMESLIQSIHSYAIDKQDETDSCKKIIDLVLAERCLNEIK